MNFRKITNKYYPDFYIDESGLYSIGIVNELYGRMKIQVMFRCSLNDGNWHVIREYVSYEIICIVEQIKKIFDRLSIISFKEKVDDGWEEIEMILPIENNYLENYNGKKISKSF